MQKHKENPLVSFVIVGWNNKSLLDECLTSITTQTYKNCNVIYVDNGSTDKSLEHVKKQYPDVIIIDAEKNHGFAIGNNIGIKKALEDKSCTFVVLLNTDARIKKDWVDKLVAFATTHPHSGSFQSPTFDYYDHAVLDSYGITVDHCGRAVQLGYRQSSSPPQTQPVFGTNAACALYTREFLEAQPFGDDYFDSDLWMYLEDVDLAARATVMGWTNWFVNKSAAYHMGSASSSKNPGFSVYMIYRNNFPMILKNFPALLIARMLPGLVVTDTQTVINLLRGHNKLALKALLRGRLYGVGLAFRILKKRRLVRKRSAISNRTLWQMMKSKP